LFVVADRVGRTEIEQRCRQSLAAYKQPAQIVLLKSLPVRGPGKIDRIALRSIAADQA
jgi:acyl-coenzyme A synthetase/AMP-(fatty) acid ligase